MTMYFFKDTIIYHKNKGIFNPTLFTSIVLYLFIFTIYTENTKLRVT